MFCGKDVYCNDRPHWSSSCYDTSWRQVPPPPPLTRGLIRVGSVSQPGNHPHDRSRLDRASVEMFSLQCLLGFLGCCKELELSYHNRYILYIIGFPQYSNLN